MWWLLPTAVLAGIGETVGWTGRLWSSYSPTLDDPFLMQYVHFPSFGRPWLMVSVLRITTTIISPTPLLAANFIILGRVISLLGPEYSRLSPKWCMYHLCTSAFLSADRLHRHHYLLWLRTQLHLLPNLHRGLLLLLIVQDVIALIVQAYGGAAASSADTPQGSANVRRSSCAV